MTSGSNAPSRKLERLDKVFKETLRQAQDDAFETVPWIRQSLIDYVLTAEDNWLINNVD